MPRIQRPLDPDACKEADDIIYARHRDDERPNALYDEGGARRPLDAVDRDQELLRSEWRALYTAALNKKKAGSDDNSLNVPDAPSDSGREPPERDVGHTVGNCPGKHWIGFKLTPAPDVNDRSQFTYWPTRAPGYANEKFAAEITDGHHDDALDTNEHVRYDGIPCGTCMFTFSTFYADVVKALTPT